MLYKCISTSHISNEPYTQDLMQKYNDNGLLHFNPFQLVDGIECVFVMIKNSRLNLSACENT